LEYDERCPGIAYTTLSCMQCGMTQCGPFVRVKWPLHGIQVRAVSESGPEGGGTDWSSPRMVPQGSTIAASFSSTGLWQKAQEGMMGAYTMAKAWIISSRKMAIHMPPLPH